MSVTVKLCTLRLFQYYMAPTLFYNCIYPCLRTTGVMGYTCTQGYARTTLKSSENVINSNTEQICQRVAGINVKQTSLLGR